MRPRCPWAVAEELQRGARLHDAAACVAGGGGGRRGAEGGTDGRRGTPVGAQAGHHGQAARSGLECASAPGLSGLGLRAAPAAYRPPSPPKSQPTEAPQSPPPPQHMNPLLSQHLLVGVSMKYSCGLSCSRRKGKVNKEPKTSASATRPNRRAAHSSHLSTPPLEAGCCSSSGDDGAGASAAGSAAAVAASSSSPVLAPILVLLCASDVPRESPGSSWQTHPCCPLSRPPFMCVAQGHRRQYDGGHKRDK